MDITVMLVNYLVSINPEYIKIATYSLMIFGSLLESMVIVGFIVPGQTVLAIGGFLAYLGLVELKWIIITSAIGAITGDLISYEIGRKYGEKWILTYGKKVLFKKEYYLKTKKLIQNYPGSSIILGRFNSFTRCFAPFLAGSSDIKFWKFITYNVIGGISWAVVFVLLGYLFGESYEIVEKYMGEGFTLITIAIILMGYLLYKSEKTKRR